ncbi:MAG: hypothetical protein MUP90_13775 [Gammaproteobacteria bacterium]|nr:hypothetical protein [Gammaproteobacteria bacterium]
MCKEPEQVYLGRYVKGLDASGPQLGMRRAEPVIKIPAHDNPLPGHVAAIVECGFATWVFGSPPAGLERQFEDQKIPVENVRLVRVWGLQVDDERELPGHERTSIPDEEIWQATLVALDGSHFEVNSELLVPASKRE